MRFLLLFLFSLLSFAWATDEVLGSRVRVLYKEPHLVDFAQEIAADAEKALEILVPIFGEPTQRITINLRDDTDTFNAFATPLPRPNAALWALFPNGGVVGLRAGDPLFLVVLHELTHNMHLSYTERPDSSEPFRFGLVGQNTARLTPPWFTEGLATWFESEHTAGGRRDAGLTKGILETIALADAWPTLTEVSLGNYSGWPGGNTRYLFGVGFVSYLIDKYGLESILNLLKAYNVGGYFGTFSDAWEKAIGTHLEEEWTSWKEEVLTVAEARTETLEEVETLTETGWFTGAASLSPDSDRIAYITWPPAIAVATLIEDGLSDEEVILEQSFPETLAWLDDETLLYNRSVRQPGSRFLELFSLNIKTGQEMQLSSGARAHFPAPYLEDCILYVRDVVPEGSSLQSLCNGETTTFWTAPNDWHITDLAVSKEGQVALSLWRSGFADVALLENGALSFLTQDAAVDKDLFWDGEDTLYFSSGRAESGIFELYSLELGSKELRQHTQSKGGAFEPLVLDDELIFTRLEEKGYDLARVSLEDEAVALTPTPLPISNLTDASLFEVQNYSPLSSLLPYGWLPLDLSAGITPIRLGAAASVLGQDDSGDHNYAFSLGYDTGLGGPLAGFYSDVQYRYLANGLLSTLLAPKPLSFGLRFGLWPHNPHLLATTETALGFRITLASTLTFDKWVARGNLDLGLLYLESFGRLQPDAQLGVSLSQRRSDDWNYPTSGPRFGVTTVLSATPDGNSLGTWANATYYQALPVLSLKGVTELGLRAGYRQSPPIPLTLQSYAAVGSTGYRLSFPVEWRYGDGLYALERITLEPRVRAWFDGNFGVGSDLGVNVDTLINYQAPVSFGVTLGYSQGFWYRFGVRLPL